VCGWDKKTNRSMYSVDDLLEEEKKKKKEKKKKNMCVFVL
jgi:hypothetical protein